MSQSENPRVQQALAELEKVAAAAADLEAYKDKTYLKYMKQLDEVYEQKMKQLQEWKDNEIKSAYKFQEGQEYLNDCNFDQKLIEIHDKVCELTKFKAQLLKSQFPEAMQYFVENGYDFSYLGIENTLEKKNTEYIITEESQQPILTNEEIQEDIEAIRQLDDWRPKGIQSQAHVSIEIPGMPPIVGVVGNLSDKTFELQLESGKILLISNLTVNNGIAKITVL